MIFSSMVLSTRRRTVLFPQRMVYIVFLSISTLFIRVSGEYVSKVSNFQTLLLACLNGVLSLYP